MRVIDEKGFNLILELCNLELNEQDKEAKLNDIDSLLDWVDHLNEVDTYNVEPLIHLSTEQIELHEDIPESPLPYKDVLQNAPSKNSNYILIPKVK